MILNMHSKTFVPMDFRIEQKNKNGKTKITARSTVNNDICS